MKECQIVSKAVAVMLLLMWALPALADLGYTITTTVERADKTAVFKETVLTVGDKARIDFLNAQGRRTGEYMITNNGGKTFVISDGSEALCANWDTADFFAAAGKMLDKGKRLVIAEVKEPKVEKVLEEPGGKIEGYDTTHIRVRTSYGAKSRIPLVSKEYEVEEVDDIWMTEDFELPVFEKLLLQAYAKTGSDYLDKITGQRVTLLETGPVLRMENVVRLRDVKKGEEQVKKERMVVSNLRQITAANVPVGHFDLPQCKPVSQEKLEKEAVKMLKNHVR